MLQKFQKIMNQKTSLVDYYYLFFYGKYQDLMEIRWKYAFNEFKMNSAVYTCLIDALEYAVRFGRKSNKKKDLLNDLNKIKYHLEKVKEYQKENGFFKKQKRQRFLIEVANNSILNQKVIEESLKLNWWYDVFYSIDIVFLIKYILYIDIDNALLILDNIKNNLFKKENILLCLKKFLKKIIISVKEIL